MNMTENDYLELKIELSKINNPRIIDDTICTKYYAGWWKFEYEEGKPSKESIFKTVGWENKNFSSEEFYQKAKDGGNKIGLKWIRNENTLYFRTLLLQGRIPLKSLRRHNTYWRTFLLKVIEKSPDSIIDIANDFEMISLLPFSTRNESVYESALEISKAIWDDSEAGKQILEILEQNNQLDLVNSLKLEKEYIKSIRKIQLKLKVFWELKLSHNNLAIISLKFDLPTKLSKEAFASLVMIEPNELSNSYNFFCDDDLQATYRRNLNGDYIKYSTSAQPTVWDSKKEEIPLMYFSNNEGTKYYVANQLKCVPSFFSFWDQIEDGRWMMISGNNFKGEKAFLLSDNNQLLESASLSFTIENYLISFYEITKDNIAKISEIAEINEKHLISFGNSTYDWTITSKMPSWLNRANMIVVQDMPKIFFYDAKNDNIPENQIDIKWRKKGEIEWKDKHIKNIPAGVIELRFCFEGVVEYDKVYNLGNFNLKYQFNDVLEASLSYEHNSLKLLITQNDLYTIDNKIGNRIVLKYVNSNQIPKRIKGKISHHTGNLLIDVIAPFDGIDIIDNEDKILENNHEFILNNLFGYRIFCGKNQSIKFYNQQYSEIVIRLKLENSLIPLINYQYTIQKLFLLADSMSSNNKVVMKIGEKTFFFQAYNARLKYRNNDNILDYSEDNRLLIQVIKNDQTKPKVYLNYNLFAIPLNCQMSNIEVIELEKNEGVYSLPNKISDSEFIVFDNAQDITCKILPTYVSTIQDNIIVPLEFSILKAKKEKRINDFAEGLAKGEINGLEWHKLNKYIKVCIEHHLPFSAFDNIRASCSSSDLTAKLYFFLICYTESNDQFIKACEKIEEELGFKFHWCSFNSFESAINWLYDTWGNIDIGPIFEKAVLYIERKYLIYDERDWKSTIHLNVELSNMRFLLKEAIINELPSTIPWLDEKRKAIIPIPNEIPKLKIMARGPIAIGLTKCNIYSDDLPLNGNKSEIWNINNNEVRRNIMYCQQIDSNWYDLAIKYTINKLKQHEL
jgi:hypothetical protein